MCGRFVLTATPEEMATLFDLPEEPKQLAPRYNIAPTQPVAIVRTDRTGDREWTHVHWGLIPSWSKDPGIGARMINARAETVAEKPSFRAAFKRRRCLVPATGFYEWKKMAGRKQPFFVTIGEESENGDGDAAHPFAFAGLWEYWEGADGSALESCTLLTTAANETMSALHHRMPVIIAPDDYAFWLGEEMEKPEDPDYLSQLHHLLHPYPDEQVHFRAVSTYVNNARNEGPECLQAVDVSLN